jgi:hypothetical protein
MSTNFHKLASNLKTNLNYYLDELLSKIPNEISNETNSPDVVILPMSDDVAYWQYYPYTRTRFTRNFGRRFPNISKHIIEQLIPLQSSVKQEDFEDQKMYEAFVNHKFDHERVQLTKVIAGVGVLPHIDTGREYVINIGVRNSNTCKVYMANNQNIKDFRQEKLESFIIEDNEAYILNVDHAHAVKTLVSKDSNLDRYLITYRLTDPCTDNDGISFDY